MDFQTIVTGMEKGPEAIDANFKLISDNQPWPGTWYKGTWGSGFTGGDVPSLFTYRLSDRVQLVIFNQQFQSVGTQAAYANATVANFPTDIPTPYIGVISDGINDIATNANAKLGIATRTITLTTGGKELSSGHIFVNAAWLSYK